MYRWDTNQYVRFDEFGLTRSGRPLDVTDDERPHETQRHVYGRDVGLVHLRPEGDDPRAPRVVVEMTAIRRILAAAVLLAALRRRCPPTAEIAPRRLIVSVEAKGGDAYTATELLQLSRSLMAAIEASGTDILLVDWGPDPFPVDDPDAVGDEVKRTADCWLVVTVGGGRRAPTLSLGLVRRPAEEAGDRAARSSSTRPSTSPTRPAAPWEAVVDLVRTAYPPLDTDQPVKATTTERPALWTKDIAQS